MDNATNLKVTAVVPKQPRNASSQFDYLMPWDLQESQNNHDQQFRETHWDNNSYQVFVQLKEGVI